MFTGLSGSGKSSLAFDTIYAEGQRRYVESLSAYARQFLEMMQKPDVDHIDGLSPAISIEQKTTSKNPRSTVGTVTEIYDYLRLLFARVGVPYSPATGLPIESQTVSQMVDRVLALPEGTRLYLLAPIVRGRKGEFRKELAELQKKGFQRVKIDGTFYEIDDAPKLDKKFKHDIDVVVDRLVVRADIATRLADSLRDGARAVRRRHRRRRARRQAAARQPRPRAPTSRRTRRTSASPSRRTSPARSPASPSPRSSRACSRSTRPPAPARPATASARSCSSSPTSSCPTTSSRLSEGAIDAVGQDRRLLALLRADADSRSPSTSRSSMSTPWDKLPKDAQLVILYGTGEDEITFATSTARAITRPQKPFEGVIGNLERRWRETDSRLDARGAASATRARIRARRATAIASSRRRWR